MHVSKIVHGGAFDKNGNFKFTKLLLQILKRDLNGNENLIKRKAFI